MPDYPLFTIHNAHLFFLSILSFTLSYSIVRTLLKKKKLVKNKINYAIWLCFWLSLGAYGVLEIFFHNEACSVFLFLNTIFTIFAVISWKIASDSLLDRNIDNDFVSASLEKSHQIVKMSNELQVKDNFINDLKLEILKLNHQVQNYKHNLELQSHEHYSADKLHVINSEIKNMWNEGVG